ncbi:hypothetical protein [Mesorhizobium sp. B3-2-1]|uniref:hypothetical protein n=1 Tax=Mesorhizobium sp. B3-2-1 TaxID=2589891 RepID=UPI001FEDFF60|nr:hypothetical protein [Mesorhizobium sp. B3-2-1]
MNYGIEHRFMDAAGVLFDFGAADPDRLRVRKKPSGQLPQLKARPRWGEAANGLSHCKGLASGGT